MHDVLARLEDFASKSHSQASINSPGLLIVSSCNSSGGNQWACVEMCGSGSLLFFIFFFFFFFEGHVFLLMRIFSG